MGARFPAVTQASLDALSALTASIDELVVPEYTASTFSVASTLWIFTAQFPLSIVQFSLVSIFTAITASDTNYWTIDLKKTTDNATSSVIATKTTQATNGAGMVQRADWNFDARPFDATAQVFAKGDSCSLLMTPTGVPSALNGLLMTARYVPL